MIDTLQEHVWEPLEHQKFITDLQMTKHNLNCIGNQMRMDYQLPGDWAYLEKISAGCSLKVAQVYRQATRALCGYKEGDLTTTQAIAAFYPNIHTANNH